MSAPLSPKFATGIIENFRSDYDAKFTTDISKQMQMPDRLRATNNAFDAAPQTFNSLNDSWKCPSLEVPYYMMESPPQVLTLHDRALMSSDDENADGVSDMEYVPDSEVGNYCSSPVKGEEHLEEGDIEVPVTPGSMLLLQNGDEMAVIRRQVAKLTRHIIHLQEDNNRRRHRELILYPLLVGYCLIQLVRLFSRSK